jgi:peptidoglycan/xylan/chitin deacetylase (PgdA/CDA1 family)
VDEGLRLPVAGADIYEVADQVEEMGADERGGLDAWLAERVSSDREDPGLRSEHVRDLVERGFEVGFHTLRHDRLDGLDDDALARALNEGRAGLERAGAPLRTIAYPHGKADTRVARAAAEAGFRLGFTGRPEPILPESNPMLLGRFEPAHGSAAALALQLARVLSKRAHR